MSGLTQPGGEAAAGPAPPPERPVEAQAEELARLRANAAASLVPAPSGGAQVAALASMVHNVFVAERARNNDVHMQQAK